jgi:hypothetical protein
MLKIAGLIKLATGKLQTRRKEKGERRKEKGERRKVKGER